MRVGAAWPRPNMLDLASYCTSDVHVLLVEQRIVFVGPRTLCTAEMKRHACTMTVCIFVIQHATVRRHSLKDVYKCYPGNGRCPD